MAIDVGPNVSAGVCAVPPSPQYAGHYSFASASASSITSPLRVTCFAVTISPDGRSTSAIRLHDGNVTIACHGSAGAPPLFGHRFVRPSSPAVLRGRKTASCGADCNGAAPGQCGWTRSRPFPDGIEMSTVGLLYWAANCPASSVDGSTSVRSHEPRFAVTSRQPSVVAEICSGSVPSGARPKPPVDLLSSSSFQLSPSITDRSPLALLGTNAKVRFSFETAG